MQPAPRPARGIEPFNGPEFTSSSQLIQHYKDVRARMARGAVRPKPEPIVVSVATLPPELPDDYNKDTSLEPLPLPNVICLPSGPVGNATRVEILYAVATAARVSVTELRSQLRARHLVDARFVYYVLARCYSGCSLPQIGKTAGGRDHCTVIHGLRMGAERFRELYPIYREACMALCLPLPDVRPFLRYAR